MNIAVHAYNMKDIPRLEAEKNSKYSEIIRIQESFSILESHQIVEEIIRRKLLLDDINKCGALIEKIKRNANNISSSERETYST